MDKVLGGLKRTSHPATALLGAAYLENALEGLLSAYFRPLGKEDWNRLFSPQARGILSTFDAKLRLAYAARLLHAKAYDALRLIGAIRNVFAHSLHKVSFKHPLVAKDCQRLSVISPTLSESARIKPDASAVDVYAEIVRTLYVSLYLRTEQLLADRND